MNKKQHKRGFTIVELVVVIVVIAILAAVLIPTISSLVSKANKSADEQAVRIMNEFLAMDSVDGSIKNVADAVKALDTHDINLEDYRPLQKDHYFYFVLVDNRPMVIYTDKDGEIVYPTNVTVADNVQRMSLSGDVPTDSSWEKNVDTSVSNTAKVNVSSGAQLAHLIENVNKNVTLKDVKTIEITLDKDVDLLGSDASFGTLNKNVTINGNSHTISGVRSDTNTTLGRWQDEPKDYYYGLINKVSKGAVVALKDVTIANTIVEDTSDSGNAYGHSGILFGQVAGTVLIENVTIRNCVVDGCDKAGALIGSISETGKATIKNVTVTDTKVLGAAYVAKVAGYIEDKGTIIFEGTNSFDVITSINEATWSRLWYGGDTNWEDDVITSSSFCGTYESIAALSTDIYLPYQRTMQTKNESGQLVTDEKLIGQLEGICTNNYYWYLGNKQEITINGKTGRYMKSGSETINN